MEFQVSTSLIQALAHDLRAGHAPFLLRHVYVMVIFNIMISLLTIRMYKKRTPK